MRMGKLCIEVAPNSKVCGDEWMCFKQFPSLNYARMLPLVYTFTFICLHHVVYAQIAYISEELCIGCGICIKKCPFEAINIINLPAVW